jgi:hypothetical protein
VIRCDWTGLDRGRVIQVSGRFFCSWSGLLHEIGVEFPCGSALKTHEHGGRFKSVGINKFCGFFAFLSLTANHYFPR